MSAKTWWDEFAASGGIPQLETWLGGPDHDSRVRIRERIAECHYESVVDCGAGLGLDFIGMKNLSHECSYVGVEPSHKLREASRDLANHYRSDPIPLVDGKIQALPFHDSSHDLVYARHIFEHLPTIEEALSEMIRVARLEAIVIFFMRPGAETYLTRERDGLWQNRWSKPQLEQHLINNPKVETFFWETLSGEVLLHAYLNESIEVEFGLVGERVE